MNVRFKPQVQGGFTLIELIVVIVILGILAATALPKFSGLTGDARLASLNAAKGAMASSSAMLHGKWLINNKNPEVEGITVTMTSNGYPAATLEGKFAEAAGLTDDYDVKVAGAAGNGGALQITQKGTPSAISDTCYLTYTPQPNGAPTILVTSTKCE